MLKSEERDKSRVTAKICFLGADATGATNWYEHFNGYFDKLLKTESNYESEKFLGAASLSRAHTFMAFNFSYLIILSW